MRVALDAMGGDHAPRETVRGALRAAREFAVDVVLVGPADRLRAELKSAGGAEGPHIAIEDAPDVIHGEDAPLQAVKHKRNSSMMVGLSRVQEGVADAFVSAGNTGALVAGSVLLLGMIPGLKRPALATFLPTLGNRPLMVVDVGACVDPKPEQLVEFAVCASIYMGRVLGVDEPQVGLMNVGTEAGKGNELVRSAFPLLQGAPIRFHGNVEGREIFNGRIDVLVTDGFVGNVVLKMAEGLGYGIFSLLRHELQADLRSRVGGLLARSRMRRVANRLDYEKYGGAPLFGPQRPVIKCHGASHAEAIANGIRRAAEFAQEHVVETLTSYFQAPEEGRQGL